MKRIKNWLDRRRTQSFVHMATYRFHELLPRGLSGWTRDDLTRCVLAAVQQSCDVHGWRLVAWDVFPERVEVLLTGEEGMGEAGAGVAAALDGAVHAATAAGAAAL
jgi:hypothetical protein